MWRASGSIWKNTKQKCLHIYPAGPNQVICPQPAVREAEKRGPLLGGRVPIQVCCAVGGLITKSRKGRMEDGQQPADPLQPPGMVEASPHPPTPGLVWPHWSWAQTHGTVSLSPLARFFGHKGDCFSGENLDSQSRSKGLGWSQSHISFSLSALNAILSNQIKLFNYGKHQTPVYRKFMC